MWGWGKRHEDLFFGSCFSVVVAGNRLSRLGIQNEMIGLGFNELQDFVPDFCGKKIDGNLPSFVSSTPGVLEAMDHRNR